MQQLNLTKAEAEQIRQRFEGTNGWKDIVEGFPKFAKAIELLPAEDGLIGINPLLKIMLHDAVCKVRGLPYDSI
jgi:hypothetical protein